MQERQAQKTPAFADWLSSRVYAGNRPDIARQIERLGLACSPSTLRKYVEEERAPTLSNVLALSIVLGEPLGKMLSVLAKDFGLTTAELGKDVATVQLRHHETGGHDMPLRDAWNAIPKPYRVDFLRDLAELVSRYQRRGRGRQPKAKEAG